jgi:hypothetical protein
MRPSGIQSPIPARKRRVCWRSKERAPSATVSQTGLCASKGARSTKPAKWHREGHSGVGGITQNVSEAPVSPAVNDDCGDHEARDQAEHQPVRPDSHFARECVWRPPTDNRASAAGHRGSDVGTLSDVYSIVARQKRGQVPAPSCGRAVLARCAVIYHSRSGFKTNGNKTYLMTQRDDFQG